MTVVLSATDIVAGYEPDLPILNGWRYDIFGKDALALVFALGHRSVAAVIGQEVPLPVWGDVTISDDELIYELVDRAVAAQVLVTPNTGTSVRFAHALIREAL